MISDNTSKNEAGYAGNKSTKKTIERERTDQTTIYELYGTR